MAQTVFVPLALLATVVGSALWVYQDATANAARGEPVVLRAGSLRMETPAVWAMACLVLWVFVLPLYLRARQRPL